MECRKAKAIAWVKANCRVVFPRYDVASNEKSMVAYARDAARVAVAAQYRFPEEALLYALFDKRCSDFTSEIS